VSALNDLGTANIRYVVKLLPNSDFHKGRRRTDAHSVTASIVTDSVGNIDVLRQGLHSVEGVAPEVLADWDADLTVAIRGLSQLRAEVRAELEGEQGRSCTNCGGSMSGRADRRYCSNRCRQAAHRRVRNE